MRWAGHVARMGEERGVYRVLLGKPEGRRPLGRPRRGWVDNIRMDHYISTHPLGHTGPVTGSLYLFTYYIYIFIYIYAHINL